MHGHMCTCICVNVRMCICVCCARVCVCLYVCVHLPLYVFISIPNFYSASKYGAKNEVQPGSTVEAIICTENHILPECPSVLKN